MDRMDRMKTGGGFECYAVTIHDWMGVCILYIWSKRDIYYSGSTLGCHGFMDPGVCNAKCQGHVPRAAAGSAH